MSTEDSTNIPYGYCRCGCGEKAPLAPQNDTARGYVKGQPMRFIYNHYHNNRSAQYIEENHGHGTPCWIWQRAVDSGGYGKWRKDGEYLAHRVYYKKAKGPIPEGLTIDHLCRVHSCVNPEHLEAVTNIENMRRGLGAKLTFDEVVRIREVRTSSGLTNRAIGELFGVSKSQVWTIVNGRCWRD